MATSSKHTSPDIENDQEKTPKYLLNEDNNYKILLLYVLRTLDKDSIQKIYNLLFTHELIDLMKEALLDSLLIINTDEDTNYKTSDIYDDIDSEGYLDFN